LSFHEVQFPTDISKGSTGGPERRTDIVTLRSGFEERNTIWAHSRRRYDASLGMRSLDDLHDVLQFFEARSGRLHAFRWKDWADYRSGSPTKTATSADQLLGVGTGALTTFQLVKLYTSGGIEYVRTIRKPVAGTALVEVAGVLKTAGTHYNIDNTTGIITFTAGNIPAPGQNVKAGYWFDVPVRFDTDYLNISVEAYEAGSVPSIDILEVRV
jgi:uncharacterized protein (TIGR02217 family)